ncbi:MAG: type I glyceraldehyde-3-phosphate dehydrogenase [Candidatus Campbellbacteria bacterium]|nr:type I glyceraldehyde-3-phosphate dehydrogenase [Candidatus Campbellbacteria bacterium]
MSKPKVALNGFGRIGRAFLQLALRDDSFDVVVINDLMPIENSEYLFKYDTAHGIDSSVSVSPDGKNLLFDNRAIKYISERNPDNLPWSDLGVEVVVETTGVFTSYEKSMVHLKAGAKKVVISAPVKDKPQGGIKGATALVGINDRVINKCDITSNASCTTNASAIPLKVLNDEIGVEKAILNTIHSYTSSQNIVDGQTRKGKNLRLGRAGAQNMIPSTTGAAVATTKVLTELEGKFDGVSIRVPVVLGSIVDITFLSKRSTSVEEVNDIFRSAADNPIYEKFFAVAEDPIVSSDMIGCPFAAVADLHSTRVVDGNLVKVFVWYDNETGYSSTLLAHTKRALGI